MNRHLKKTISFAALHFSVAFAVTYLLTGDWRVSGAVALIEPCVNTVAFFFHELFWTRREQQEPGLVPAPHQA
ncbi:DUF2061 domain-containing protein [Variovorax saccharolyticus]|uniref:DUF2061 domain-containing protein n=1 Tax=Variovorax saccharolyticus TaxID=3053516 RepID=UPI002576F747|nr:MULTISPECIES: DUF2061 domain-containing protein [unclassified Variovorax]MDM0019202.1 DUF2061 domain-containing protein [Variovorax sp. J22R187]MDM0026073.1 DUF2061 domain-containing protein [Variovorax sp. J31P216]